ncbi:MAG: FAD-binding oxidoreductase [Candidatus Methylomirabilales bacterium]
MPRELAQLPERLRGIVGEAHVLQGEAAATFAVDGVRPSVVARPGTQEEVGAVVAAAAQAGAAIAPWGSGAAMRLGSPPARLDLVLSLQRLQRVVEFDAANLVVTVEAGARLGDLQALLAAQREFLPLDPAGTERRTVGGVLATNASGPSRLLYGTARDLVLGLRAVLASGERIRCGGKVIKNVSGYDLNKLFIGSLGTLGILTEATFKLLPAPAARATVLAVCPGLAQAEAAAARTLESFLLPESLDLLSPHALARLAGSVALAGAGGYGLAAGVAGSRETVERQVRDLERLFTEAGATRTGTARDAASGTVGAAVRDVLEDGGAGRDAVAVKLGVPIRRTCALVAAAEALGSRHGWRTVASAHAGSGIVRAVYAAAGAEAAQVRDGLEALRAEAAAAGGSLVVEAAPPAIKSGLDVWGKPGDGLAVMHRLKAEFDPRGVLNPGRFVGGI